MLLWMLRALSVACLVGAAALVGDAANREAGRPRRWTWLAALGLSVLLPVIGPHVVTLPALGVPTTLRPSDHAAVAYVERASTSIGAMILWSVASIGLLSLFVWAHRRARRAAAGSPTTIEGVEVIVSEQLGPAVVGITQPRVVLPKWAMSAPPGDQALIIRHEAEHVRARDTVLLALSAAAVVLMPWNPVVWWQSRRLRRAVETDCDARVLATGCDVREYGATLIAMAARTFCFAPVVPLFGGSRRFLAERIHEITAVPAERRGPRVASLIVAAALLLVGAASVAVPSGPLVIGRELVVVRAASTSERSHARASLVLLDGRVSSYEEIRAIARAKKLGPLKILMPDQAVQRYGPRAVTGALIANTK